MITGKTLIQWGVDPKGKGKWFGEMIDFANSLRDDGLSDHAIQEQIRQMEPVLPPEIPYRTNKIPFEVFLEPESVVERDNLAAVTKCMDELMRVPTVVSGVVMPDACPAGTIPVGGVVATKDAIHPGFHSADICCSMAITVFKRKDDPKKLLDAAMNVTHFGPGGRKRDPFVMSAGLVQDFRDNRFLSDAVDLGNSNLGTQGDGNHFLFVGTLRSTGQLAMVTHHGSRGVGALLYKRGMAVAKRHTSIVSPRTPQGAAWIDANSDEGRAYWDALQIARQWTKENHFGLHERIARMIGNRIDYQTWNEHNFVFQRDDGLFYHAKGATPSFKGFSKDDDGRTLIPLNMSQPILIAEHRDKKEALGFSPHGAGRNYSRTQHMRLLSDDPRGISDRDKQTIFERETKGLDIRSYLGRPDLSELPSAYKSAEQVQGQIRKHGLAEVVDYVDPYGSIMAGEIVWQKRVKKGKDR
jgi:RNA-splicing ligase RtcB